MQCAEREVEKERGPLAVSRFLPRQFPMDDNATATKLNATTTATRTASVGQPNSAEKSKTSDFYHTQHLPNRFNDPSKLMEFVL